MNSLEAVALDQFDNPAKTGLHIGRQRFEFISNSIVKQLPSGCIIAFLQCGRHGATCISPLRRFILSHKNLMGSKEPPPGEMLRDTLDMLILKTLQRGPMHGYGISEYIEERSEDVLRVEEGALYPALHRLELRGLLSSEWGVSDNRRRAKFYRLTATGRKQLQKDSDRWGLMSAAIGRIMETA
jgi:PadR family transcriptional regulator PadR